MCRFVKIRQGRGKAPKPLRLSPPLLPPHPYSPPPPWTRSTSNSACYPSLNQELAVLLPFPLLQPLLPPPAAGSSPSTCRSRRPWRVWRGERRTGGGRVGWEGACSKADFV